MTEVVAALIWDQNRFLACQRPSHKARGLLWEFVGGKVEPGETKPQALIRECREELDIAVTVGDVFMEQIHEYPDLTIRLTVYNATILEGSPQKLEHNDIRWLRIDEIPSYEFCPADAVILEELLHKDIEKQLFELQDMGYRAFNSKLVPEISEDKMIGVRMPQLRQLGKRIGNTPQANAFLHYLPHRYFEEDNLHSALISEIKDFNAAVAAVDTFLPYVDNWATCDMLNPKAFRKQPERLLEHIRIWLASEHTYTVRFGIGVLMRYFLDGTFQPEYLAWVSALRSEKYYINMMIAWYFATALAKQYESAIPYIENNLLDKWTHNKAIQKARESYRVLDAHKEYLSKLIRKA